ncbi:MAG: sugar ABC transporter permease, partial [Actinobacteria bacterium]|nr:sugar ABC transporter permease [Actinomycetota bacterium]
MTTASGGGATAIAVAPRRRGRPGWGTLLFLLPAAVLLGALVAYPIVFTVIRSLFDRGGDSFIGIDNYSRVFTNPRTLIALRNNVIWVVVAPSVVTALGLIFAVLTERVRWSVAFKTAVFMPMAISFLAAGVIFRLVYEHDPDRGLANAMLTTVVDPFREPAPYPGTRVRDLAGSETDFAVVGLPPAQVPEDALPARRPRRAAADGTITGTVWLDFSRGGGGESGVIDDGEVGLPGMVVEAVAPSGEVVGSAEAAADGRYVIEGLDDPDGVTLRLAAS